MGAQHIAQTDDRNRLGTISTEYHHYVQNSHRFQRNFLNIRLVRNKIYVLPA